MTQLIMPSPLCTQPRCSRSIVVQHVNGDTSDQCVLNRKFLGFAPLGNHQHSLFCGVNPAWRSLPLLTDEQCDKLRNEGVVVAPSLLH